MATKAKLLSCLYNSYLSYSIQCERDM